MKRIVIVYTNAGGGHKSAALAIQEMINHNSNCQVELVNISDLAKDFDLFKKITSVPADRVYNKLVSGDNYSLIGLFFMSVVFQLNLKLYFKKMLKLLQHKWAELKPDLVISVMPFVNELLHNSTATANPVVKFATLITDYSECIKKIWIVDTKQNLICCSGELVTQASRFGVEKNRIYRLSGMIVSPKYYTVKNKDKNLLAKQLGLKADLPAALIMFGSSGSRDMLNIALSMLHSEKKIQLVFICGNNVNLLNKLTALKLNNAICLGFVNNVEEYMYCADFFVGKPGGISISEAAISNLPMILKYNSLTLLQERYNARWVVEHGIGITVNNFRTIAKDIQKILDNNAFYQDNLNKLKNNAIFELPEVLNKILQS